MWNLLLNNKKLGGYNYGIYNRSFGCRLIVFFLKKENNKLKEMVGNLNEEQKNKLALTDVKFVEEKNDEWIQEGMIGEMKDKGYKYAISFMA